jgi:hypothetical protein
MKTTSKVRTLAATLITIGSLAGGEAIAGTVVFQQGLNGYDSAHQGELRAGAPDWSSSTQPYIYIYPGDAISGLISFDNVFGTGTGQIAPGSTITNASLELTRLSGQHEDGTVDLHQMLTGWNDDLTWSTATLNGNTQGGIQRDGVEASASASLLNAGGNTFDITADVQAWSAGAENHGWAIFSNTSHSWFSGNGNSQAAARPMLTIEYQAVPEPSSTALLGLGGLALMLRRRR